MALTIQSTPGSYYSAQGDLLFVVVDIVKANDPVTYPDYKYVADVYIGTTLVTRLKVAPRPDNKMGVFQIGEIVRSYLSSNFNPTAGALRAQEIGSGEFFVEVTVKFGEEYDFSLYTNVTVDTQRIYFNHYNGRLIGVDTNLAALTNKPLSARPILTTSFSQDFLFIPYLPTSTSSITLKLESYTVGNTLQQTYSPGIAPSAANTLQQFNVGLNVINAASAGFSNAATAYYLVYFNDVLYYRINVGCEVRHETYTLHFLNRYGGFETKDFSKVSRKTIDIEKSEFGKLPYTIDISGNVSYRNSNNVYNESRSVYASQYSEKLKLNADITTDDEYRWLGDLVLSPLVYLEMQGYFIPVAVKSSNYEFRKVINDKLTNLFVDIEFGEQLNAQYR